MKSVLLLLIQATRLVFDHNQLSVVGSSCHYYYYPNLSPPLSSLSHLAANLCNQDEDQSTSNTSLSPVPQHCPTTLSSFPAITDSIQQQLFSLPINSGTKRVIEPNYSSFGRWFFYALQLEPQRQVSDYNTIKHQQ